MTDQTTFRAGLLDASKPVPDGLVDGLARPAGRRYNVYRNNVTASLIDAMKTAFPLVRKLIGPVNFDALAPLYVRGHPPKSPLMMFYGTDFPLFLRGFKPLAQIGYLGDAAALDLALRHSYHAADCAPFDQSILESVDPDVLMDAKISLAPSTIVLTSAWPLFDIWRYNTETNAPKPRAVAQDVIITRPAFDPTPHALPQGAAAWLLALQDGHSFGEATDIAHTKSPDFDLATTLGSALATQALHLITHKDLT
jgi:hypothetical protein